jgi:hypothetical protein
MRLASYVPGELIPLPLSGSIPELPHVEKVFFAVDVRSRWLPLAGHSSNFLMMDWNESLGFSIS